MEANDKLTQLAVEKEKARLRLLIVKNLKEATKRKTNNKKTLKADTSNSASNTDTNYT